MFNNKERVAYIAKELIEVDAILDEVLLRRQQVIRLIASLHEDIKRGPLGYSVEVYGEDIDTHTKVCPSVITTQLFGMTEEQQLEELRVINNKNKLIREVYELLNSVKDS